MVWDDKGRPYGPTVLIAGLLIGTAVSLALTSSLRMPQPDAGGADPRAGTEAPAARSYNELAATPWAQPQAFESILANLPVRGGRIDDASRETWILQRARRRAFDGAPPVVPHAMPERSAASCLTCHADGMAFPRGDRASTICHDVHAACTQCHVPADTTIPGVDPALTEERLGDTRFVGWAGSVGATAAPGAPPMIPHATWMRERCDACHGDAGPNPLRTQHPDRTHCRQCHASSAQLDQHPEAG